MALPTGGSMFAAASLPLSYHSRRHCALSHHCSRRHDGLSPVASTAPLHADLGRTQRRLPEAISSLVLIWPYLIDLVLMDLVYVCLTALADGWSKGSHVGRIYMGVPLYSRSSIFSSK